MPSVVAGVNQELSDLIDRLVEEGRYEDRNEAVEEMLKYTAYNKYNEQV